MKRLRANRDHRSEYSDRILERRIQCTARFGREMAGIDRSDYLQKSMRQVSRCMDREAGDLLLETLERMKEMLGRHAARRENRFWKKIDVPSSFIDLLGGITKEEMSEISKMHGLKRLSSLRKADLAAKLVELMPDRYAKTLYTLDQVRYGLLKSAVKKLRGAEEGRPGYGKSTGAALPLPSFPLHLQ